MRIVATGIVLSLLLCIYLCLFAGLFFLTACFWRNKDAYKIHLQLQIPKVLGKPLGIGRVSK